MVVKSQIKFIKSLQQKKYRSRHKMFVAEGIKTVRELLLSRYKEHAIYSTDPNLFKDLDISTHPISASDLIKISGYKNPNTVLGVFYIPDPIPVPVDFNDWILALDDINDPGNFGTIIRLCDWFGITHILCSETTVDCFNPKVLQASMGSISRVNMVYTNLIDALKKSRLPVYGAFMDGENVYGKMLPEAGILVMGNEARGISEEVSPLISAKISIPQFGKKTTESLNVGTATAILLNEIRRPEGSKQ
ncbi:MAG: RNA methyltransferase [Gramella sp.]|nr:RNA methyltransferase [Christiangramia sp.]